MRLVGRGARMRRAVGVIAALALASGLTGGAEAGAGVATAAPVVTTSQAGQVGQAAQGKAAQDDPPPDPGGPTAEELAAQQGQVTGAEGGEPAIAAQTAGPPPEPGGEPPTAFAFAGPGNGNFCDNKAYQVQGKESSQLRTVDISTGDKINDIGGLTTPAYIAMGYSRNDGKLYGIHYGGSANKIFMLDPATGQRSFPGASGATVPAGGSYYAADSSLDGKTLYLVHKEESVVYSVNTEAGSSGYMGLRERIPMDANHGTVEDVALNPVDGNLYGFVQNGSGAGRLVKFAINEPGTTKKFTSTPLRIPDVNFAASAWFDSIGNLYLANTNRISGDKGGFYQVDLTKKDSSGQVIIPATAVKLGETDANDYADGAGCILAEDFGDAPPSYGTNGADPVRHYLRPGFNMGRDADAEPGPGPAAELNGARDDLTNRDDEDAVDSMPVATAGRSGPYSVTLKINNTDEDDARLGAWVDFNSNGTFDPGERQVVPVPKNATSVTVTWPNPAIPAGMGGKSTYARFRLYDDNISDPTPTGSYDGAGEVEDHVVQIMRFEGPCSSHQFIALRSGATGSTQLARLDLGTGAVTNLGRPYANGFDAMGYNPADLDLYAIDITNLDLLKFSSATGDLIGRTPTSGLNLNVKTWALRAGDVSADGQSLYVYAVSGPGGTYTDWRSVDLKTGVATSIPAGPRPVPVDAALNRHDGRLYGNQFVLATSSNAGTYFDPNAAGVPPNDWQTNWFDDLGNAYYLRKNGQIFKFDWTAFTEATTARADLEGPKGVLVGQTDAATAAKVVDGAGCVDIRDYGDAPDSYKSTEAAGGPNAKVSAGLRLGAADDAEPGPRRPVSADGGSLKPLDGTGDPSDDAVTDMPELAAGKLQPYLVKAKVTNTTGAAAKLVGWVDFNGDGDFADPGEQSAVVPVPANAVEVNVPWAETSVPEDLGGKGTFARLRLYDAAQSGAPQPTGPYEGGGEVEDWRVRVVGPIPGGQPGPQLWLKANDGVDAPGGNVAQWNDRADHSKITDQAKPPAGPTAAIKKVDGELNFNPVVRFDGAAKQALNGNLATPYGTDPVLFVVGRAVKGGPSNGALFAAGTGNDPMRGYGPGISASGQSNLAGAIGDGTSGNGLIQGSQPMLGRYRLYSARYGDAGKTWAEVDAPLGSSNGMDQPPLVPGTRFEVGGLGSWSAAGGTILKGDVAEVILMPAAMTEAQRNRIESYLAVKYGITLGSPAKPGTYHSTDGTAVWTGNAEYQYGVAGLARDQLTGLDQRVSQSIEDTDQPTLANGPYTFTDPVTAGAPASRPGDGTYLMWGHNNRSVATKHTVTGLPGVEVRSERVWRTQVTKAQGMAGTVTMRFSDRAVRGFYLSDPHVLVSADPAFPGTATTKVPLTKNAAGDWVAEVAGLPGAYFTLGGRAELHCSATLYVSDTAVPATVRTVGPITGKVTGTVRGNLPAGATALAWSPLTGKLYGTSGADQGPVYSLDPTTGTSELIPTYWRSAVADRPWSAPEHTSAAISMDGKWYHTYSDLPGKRLVKVNIDPESPEYGSVVYFPNNTGDQGVTAIALNPLDGDLYGLGTTGAAKGKIVRIDADTGAATVGGHVAVADPGRGRPFFDAGGSFYYLSENAGLPLYRVQFPPTSGNASWDMATPVTGLLSGNWTAGAALGDTAGCVTVKDFGDAPDSYGTVAPGGAATDLSDGLTLGPRISPEADARANAAGVLDGLGDTFDDALPAPPKALLFQRTFSLPGIEVHVPAGKTATLVAWADLDGDGTFSDAERSVPLPLTDTADRVTLTWDAPPQASKGAAGNFLRMRLYDGDVPDADLKPGGVFAGVGEVEDWPLEVQATDLELTSAVPAGLIAPGAEGTVTVTATNKGPGSTTDPTVVTVELPPGTTAGATLPAGCVADAAGTKVVCTHTAVLASGDTVALAIPVKVPANAPLDTELPGGSASVAAPADDVDGNNVAAFAVRTPLKPVSDLTVTVAGPAAPVEPGGSGSTVLTVTNAGPSDTRTPSTVTVVPPDGVTVSGYPPTCTPAGRGVVCRVDPLTVGSNVQIPLDLEVSPEAQLNTELPDGKVSVVNTDVEDADSPNTVDLKVSTTLTGKSDLFVQVPAAAEVSPGAVVDLRVTVLNLGPVTTGELATLTVSLPDRTTLAAPPEGCLETVPGTLTCQVLAGTERLRGTTFVIPLKINPDVPQGTPLSGEASVVFTVTPDKDPDPGNNTVPFTVKPGAAESDLGVAVTGRPRMFRSTPR